jgi:hypothetical protein
MEFRQTIFAAIVGGLLTIGGTYFITAKTIEFNKQDSEYKETFKLKFKAFNDLKKTMYDLELTSVGAKKFNQNISDLDTYNNQFATTMVEIETLITNTSTIKKAKLINQKNVNTLFLVSHKWLYLYSQLFQLTSGKTPDEQKQKFILEEIQPMIAIASFEYQTYLYQVLFKEKSYNQQEINNILDNLDIVLKKINS